MTLNMNGKEEIFFLEKQFIVFFFNVEVIIFKKEKNKQKERKQ